MTSDLVLFAGNSNRLLAEKISQYIDVPLGEALVGRFSDGESRIELKRNIRGKDVFILQSTCFPVNHHIMEALILIDACRRASAETITLVTPYFGYARQERKSSSRTPISAKLVAELFEVAGIHRLLALELHNSAIQGFFNVPVDNLYARPVFSAHFGELGDSPIIVSPDAGGVERARAMAKQFNCGLAIIDKRRENPNESAVMNLIGNVEGKDCIIFDDIVDTGGSLVQAAEALMANGGRSVSAAITHAVLSGPAVERINQSKLKNLVVTDSIPLSAEAEKSPKITQISIARLMAKAITRIHNRDSISSLFV